MTDLTLEDLDSNLLNLLLKPDKHFQDNRYTNNGTVVDVTEYDGPYFSLHQGDHEIILNNTDDPPLTNPWDFAVFAKLEAGTDYYFSFKYYSSFATTVTENVPDVQIEQDMADNDLLNVTLYNANMEVKEYVRRFRATVTGVTRIHFANPGATEGAIAIRDIRLERSFPSPSLQFIPRNHLSEFQPWGYVNNQYENNGAVLEVPYLNGADINNPFKHRYLTQGNNKITFDGITASHSLKVKVKIEAHTEYRLSFKYFSNQANAKLDIKVQNDGSDDDLLQFTLNDIDSTEKQYVQDFKPTALAPFDQDGNSVHNGWMDIAFSLTDVNNDATPPSLNDNDYFLYKISADQAYPNICADNDEDTIIWIGQVTTGGDIQWNWVGSDGNHKRNEIDPVCIYSRAQANDVQDSQGWLNTYFGADGYSPTYIKMPTNISNLDYRDVVRTTPEKELVAADFSNWSTYEKLSTLTYFLYKIIADKPYPNICADDGDTIIWIGQVTTGQVTTGQVTTGGNIQWNWVGSDGNHKRNEIDPVCIFSRAQAGDKPLDWLETYFGSAGFAPTYIPTMPITMSQLDYSNVVQLDTRDKQLVAADFSNWSTYKPVLGNLTIQNISVDRVHPPTLLQLMPLKNGTYKSSGETLSIPQDYDADQFARNPIYLTQGNNKFIVNATSALETCFWIQVDLEPNTVYYVAFKYKSSEATAATLQIFNEWSDATKLNVTLTDVDSTEKQYVKRFEASALDTNNSANNGKTLLYFETKAAVGTTVTVENISVGRFHPNTATVITLNDHDPLNPLRVPMNTTYSDPGATATDLFDGDLPSSSIVVDTSNLNMSAVGTYTVTYNVTDEVGNVADEVTRTVIVYFDWSQVDLFDWSQVGGDIDGETAGDWSGNSISLSSDGKTVAFGAKFNDGVNGAAADSGHVRVYEYNSIDGAWTQKGEDIDGETAGDYSGNSVSLSSDGSTVAIGAPYNDGNGANSGHVRIYEFIDGEWKKVGGDIDGETAGNESGWSVSLSSDGKTVAIGATLNDGNATRLGHVRVYEFIDGAWTKVGGDIDGESNFDYSGYSVSLSSDGKTVAIGARENYGKHIGHDNGAYTGHVRVYEYNSIDGAWTQVGGDIDGETAYDRSGHSVSLSSDGKTVAIGAWGNDANGNQSGHVRVYEFIDGAWTKVGGEIDGDIDGDAELNFSGWSVSLSSDGKTVAIGAPMNDGNGADSGHVRVYRYDGAAWGQVRLDIDGEAAGDRLGYSVSLSSDGTTVAIGATRNDANGEDSGHVRVYELKAVPPVITLNGDTLVVLKKDTEYQEKSATATDSGGGIVTVDTSIKYNGNSVDSVDTSVVGTYVITYSATDSIGNIGTKERIIVVTDAEITNFDWSQVDLFDWSQVGGDIDGETAGDQSGYSVSLSSDGKTVAIGAPANNSGHVRVYEYNSIDGAWTQKGEDIDGETAGDYSGNSISLSSDGSTVAIGAKYNDGNGEMSGHFRVYKFIDGAWTKLGGDIHGEAAGDWSGHSVSLSSDGSTVAIGARLNDGNGADSGHVRVYEFIDGAWTKVGGDIDGEAADDYSGYVVSLSSDGKTVAIGAWGNDANGTNSGHVRVYQYNGISWKKVGDDIDGDTAGDVSGHSVSLSSDGKTVAIGAPMNDGNGTNSGHVRIYEFIDGAWTQVGRDIYGDIEGASGDVSGYSVSLSSDGKTVAIGAKYNDGNGADSGHVRVYRYNGAAWGLVGLDIDGEAADDWSGHSISLSSDGTTVAIGVPHNDANGTDSGHVRVYELKANFDWSQVNLFDWSQVGGDIDGVAAGDESGDSVSLSSDGKTVAIGAPYNDGVNGTDSGHVRVYRYNSIDGAWRWRQLGEDIDGKTEGDYSGRSVSLSSDGSTVAIGAPYTINGEAADSGHVRVYRYRYNSIDGEWRWRQLGEDIYGEAADDQSGSSVSLSSDGKTVAIGAKFNDGVKGADSGHVRVYEYNSIDGAWTQLGEDIDGDTAGDFSGDSVSLSSDGKTVAISARYNDGVYGTDSGHVRVYEFIDGAWKKLGDDIDGKTAYDWSGNSVSLSSDGKTVAIGARLNDGVNGTDSGHVRVYEYNSIDDAWTQVGGDIHGEAAGDQSGTSVSLSSDGKTVAIGARFNNDNGANSGHVRVYRYIDGAWTQVRGDIDGDIYGEAAGDWSGSSVSLSSDGKTVAIGATRNDGNGAADSGHVRVYELKAVPPVITLNGDTLVVLKKGTEYQDPNATATDNIGGVLTVDTSIKYNGNSVHSVDTSVVGTYVITYSATDSIGNIGTKERIIVVTDAEITNFDWSQVNLFDWSQVGGDIDGEAGDQSGYSVSLSSDGKTVAIAANLKDANGNTISGHVRVYEYNSIDRAWTQKGEDIDGASAHSVSLSSDGKTVAIGSPYEGTLIGHVRVYQYNGISWRKVGDDIDGEAAGDLSGYSVSLSSDGSTVAIGARMNDDNATQSGHVRVYKFIDGAWEKVGGDIDGEAAYDYSGHSVSLSSDGKTVAISARYNDGVNGADSGHVRVYQYNGISWRKVGDDIDGKALNDYSGNSVSLSSDGKTVAIGAASNDTNGENSGHFRVYEYDGNSWEQLGGDIDGAAAGDFSGFSVSLSSDGKTVAIGAPFNHGNGTDSGHVRVYRYDGAAWGQVRLDIDGETASDKSGWSVSLSSDGTTVAIGATLNDGNGADSGHVRVYTIDITKLAIAVNGYYPLYEKQIHANSVSSSNSSHLHELNDTTYYMPDNLSAEDQYHGNYTVERVARRGRMKATQTKNNGRSLRSDNDAIVAFKEEIENSTDKKSARRLGLKLMFNNDSSLKQIPMTRTELGLSDKLKRENVLVVKAGETINISDVNSNNESFYCSLENDEQVTLSKDGKSFTVKRKDTVDGEERYAILNSTELKSISKGGVDYTAGLYDLKEDDEFSVTFDTETHDFFIGSVGDASAQSVTVNENSSVQIILGSDPDPSLTYAIVSFPTNGYLRSLSGNTVTYFPDPDYTGPDSFKFTVSDGTSVSSPATVNITVNATPTADDQSVTVNEGSSVQIILSGSDPDNNDTLTYTVVSGPANGSFDLSGNTLTYTPTASGPDSFTFTVSDDTSVSTPATVDITVNAVASGGDGGGSGGASGDPFLVTLL